jgi:hypothetical protein
MQVYKVVGELVSARHILIVPRVSFEDEMRAEEELKAIRDLITSTDTITFERAARLYSDDESTKT